MTVRAPAKLNLCLYLGPTRDDGLHELCSVFAPLSLADHLLVETAEHDEVLCPGIEGTNLAERALTGLRELGWDHRPVRITITKRIPVAAGLGGGSADAAAVLRLASELEGREELAERLGADVRSQLDPQPALVRGAGEVVAPLPAQAPWAAVLVPSAHGLSTADVYREADRLGVARSSAELDAVAETLDERAERFNPLGEAALLVNDLQPAALSLRPEIADALGALDDAGATLSRVTGSGPTAFGLLADLPAADAAAARIDPAFDPIVVVPA